MGQLLIVQGPDPEERKRLLDSGVALFESLHRVRPSNRVNLPQTSIAVFPPREGKAASLLQDGLPGWICGVGTWFYEGLSGEEGLRRLALHQASRPDDSTWLRELDGSFAIALGEPGSDRLRIITDPLGTLHIYTVQSGSATILCTSSLTLAYLAQPEWDPVGCRQFLATGTIFESRTLFAGIEKLVPATVYTFSSGTTPARNTYWRLSDVLYDRAPRPTDVADLAAALQQALKTVRLNFSHPAMDLTGGFDSRAILGAALQAGASFETVVNGAANNPDVVAAQRIAREFHLTHHHNPRVPPTEEEWENHVSEALALCDGEYDATLYAPVFATHTRLAKNFDASINGSNGEVAKGYWWELLVPHTGKPGHFDAAMVARRRFVADGECSGLLAAKFDEDLGELFAGIIRRASAGLETYPNTALMDNVYLRLRMQRWQGRIASATSRIWPCVSPFCFRGPMEAALAAPPSVRWNNRMSRRLLELQNPKLAALPLAEGYPALPWRLSNAHRFGPLYAEMSRALIRRAFLTAGLPSPFAGKAPAQSGNSFWDHRLVGDLLEGQAMKTSHLYNREKLDGVFRDSRSGSALATSRASRILTLEMLARAIRPGR
jgi:asparagine synthetase B (glutamine-hydrolysing)